jgi:hypothetical protein
VAMIEQEHEKAMMITSCGNSETNVTAGKRNKLKNMINISN